MTRRNNFPQQDALVLAHLYKVFESVIKKIPAARLAAIDAEVQANAAQLLIAAAESGERNAQNLERLASDSLRFGALRGDRA